MSNAYLEYMRSRHAKALVRIAKSSELVRQRFKDILGALDGCARTIDDVGLPDIAQQIRLVQRWVREIRPEDGAEKPAFRVYVRPMPASNGLTYFVILERADRELGKDQPTDGYISAINRHNVAEANSEGYSWAAFLGVPFTPCEAVVDTATHKSVMENGVAQTPIEAMHLLRHAVRDAIMDHFDIAKYNTEASTGGPYVPIVMTMFEAIGRAYEVEVDGHKAVIDTVVGRGHQSCYIREDLSIQFDGSQHLELKDSCLYFKDSEGKRHTVRFAFTYKPRQPST